MSTIVLRSVKGTPLTNTEVDTNFTNLNTDKLEAATSATLTNKTINLTSNTLVATSAQLLAAITDETGTGSLVFNTSPTFVTPILGTPTSGNFSTGTFTWPTFNQNTTGTAAGLSATLATTSGGTNLTSFTSGGVVYASSSSALATGSALVFDGSKLTVTGATGAPYLVLNAPTDGGYASLQVGGTAFADFGSFKGINGSGSATDFYLGTRSTNNLIFGTNFTEGMRLTSTSLYTASGINVGIGTNDPQRRIDAQSTTADYQLRLGYNASFYYDIGRVNSNGYLGFYGSQTGATGFIFGGVNGTWATINSTGNMGLGVTPINAYTGLAYKNFELPKAAFFSFDVTGSRPIMGLKSNVYYDSGGNTLFNGNGYAVQYLTDSGNHQWYTSTISNSSGAGASCSLTQAMTLNTAGSLLLGTTALRVTGYTTDNSQYAMENTGYGGAQWFTNRTDNIGSFLVIGKSRGTTANSNAVVANGDELGALVFMGATGSGVASAAFVYAKVDGSTISSSSMPGRLEFHTTPSGSTSPTLRMQIGSGGDVGIGSGALTAYRLTVAKGAEDAGQIGLANFRTEATTSSAYNAGVQIFATATSVAANRSTSVIWDADGADGAGGNYFYINKLGNDGRVDLIQASNAAMNFAANYANRGTFDMTLIASGNLGIGTNNPAANLHISRTTAASVMISNTSTSLVTDDLMGVIDFSAGTANTVNARISGLVVGTSESGGTLSFETRVDGGSLSEKMRLSSHGNLLFNAADNGSRIHVLQNNTVTGGIAITGTTWVGIDFFNSNADANARNWKMATTYTSFGMFELLSSSTQGGTDYATCLSLTRGSSLALQGALPQTGTGITFPATQSASSNANTLDDYEEGTWTPNQGSGLTVSGSFESAGYYTKIGNLVTISGFVRGTAGIVCSAAGIICTNAIFPGGVAGIFWTGSVLNWNADSGASCGVQQNLSNIYNGTAVTTSDRISFTITYRT